MTNLSDRGSIEDHTFHVATSPGAETAWCGDGIADSRKERHCSEKIFEILKNKKILKSEHLDLLINSYTKNLDLWGLDKSLIPDIVGRLQTFGKGILSLKASPSNVEENLYGPLMSALPNVERINLDVEPSNAMCEAVGVNCAVLKILEMCNRPNYIYFFFRCDEKHDGISFIMKNCPCVETLEYRDTIGVLYVMHKTNVSKRDFEEQKKYALTNLSSTHRNYPLKDALEICAITCPYVTRLQIDKLFSKEEIEKMSHLPLLEDLKINWVDKSTMSCLNSFLKLRGSRLTDLYLPFNLSLSVITLVESCPKLKSLTLKNCGTTALSKYNSEVAHKSSFPSLKILKFIKIPFELEGCLGALKLLFLAAKSIKELTLLTCSGLTIERVNSLDLCNIYELYLYKCDIKVDSLKELFVHGNLLSLNFEKCCNLHSNHCCWLRKFLPNKKRNLAHITCSC